MLLDIKEGDSSYSELKEIYEAGNRAAGLTKQLLAFSRKQPMEIQAVNLNILVSGMAKMTQRLIGEDIELQLHLADNIPTIMADPGQIDQIILNLAANARDAMPSGGHFVFECSIVLLEHRDIRSRPKIEPGKYVLFSASDTGEGMTEDVQKHIFEPFFTTKEQGKGTGLGLATIYGIVKQHKGHIFVYSEPGKGTSFKIYFPVSGEKSVKPVPKKQIILQPGTETILVVDDDPKILKLIDSLLSSLGYTVLIAENGVKAIDICQSEGAKISLLLTDVVMPGINGKDLTEKIQTFLPAVKTIYMQAIPIIFFPTK